jgi:esterase
MLNTVLYPAQTAAKAPPLLIVHGLFGSARNWGVIARRMSADRDVVAVDMRNHGTSPALPSHSYPDMAGDLAEVIAVHGGRMDVVGHSMGGKATMLLALTHNDMVGRLIVADIAPVAYDHDQSQHIKAMRGLDLSGLSTRSEADKRLAQAMDDPALRAFFLQSLDLKAMPPRWRLNLDVLEAEMPKIVGWPGTEAVFDGPVLFLAGAQSHYIQPEYRAGIRALFPAARFAKIPGAGHWLHADKPREFEETMRVFLTR